MSKQIPLGILLTNWIVGLFFILLSPQIFKAAPALESSKTYIKTTQALIYESCSLPSSSGLELDVEFFQSPQIFRTLLYSKSAVIALTDSVYDSVPFFDVKQTFIHYFFSW